MIRNLFLLLFMIIVIGRSFSEENVWIFPTSGHYQRLEEYNESYDFSIDKVEDFSIDLEIFRFSPFFISDKRFFYYDLNEVQIDRESARLNNYFYNSVIVNNKEMVFIEGGDYFASNVSPPNEYYANIFNNVSNAREYFLEDSPEKIDNSLYDMALLYPQQIKNVNLSTPFLEEDTKYGKLIYDNDVIYYRWFSLFPRSRLAYFVNDPTPMVEGAPGSGVGLKIFIEYNIPTNNLIILNGFVDLKRQYLYRRNARMKKVLIAGEGFEYEYEFQDYVHFAQVDFPDYVSNVTITVIEVYEGERYEDLCISGLFVNPDVLNTKNSNLAREFLNEAEKFYK